MRLRKISILFIFPLSIFSNYADANTINVSTGVKANVISNTTVVLSTGNASGLICNGSAVKLLVDNGEALDIQDYFIEWSTTANGSFVGLNGNPTAANNYTGSQILIGPGQELTPTTFNSGTFGNQFYIRIRYWVDDINFTGVSRTEDNSYYSDPIYVQFYPPASVTSSVLGGNDQNLCLNDLAANLTLSNTVGTKYVWAVSSNSITGTYGTVSTTTGLASTAQSPTTIVLPGNLVNTATPGVKYYRVLVTNGDGCIIAKVVYFTVVVKPNSSIQSAAGSGTSTQTICINNRLTDIVYATSNVTTARLLSGSLPPGVTLGVYSTTATTTAQKLINNPATATNSATTITASTTGQITLTGTPTIAGTYTYTIVAEGNCASATTTGTITVNPNATIALQSGSSTTTVCINNTITPIVYQTTYIATDIIITAGRLPGGLTGTFSNSSKQYTISGTATESGTFTYTVTTVGGCITSSYTASITIKPDATIALIGGSSTTTVCVNTLITPIVYESTSSASSISIVVGGLPAGLTSGFNNTTKQFTISGTATQSGTFTYTIATTGDCVTATTTGTITINPNATITLQSGSSTPTICINNEITPIVYKSTSSTSAMSIVAGGLPGGLSYGYDNINKTFTISGTATQSGTFTYTIATAGICVTATTIGTITIKPDNTITLNSAVGTISQTVCVNTSLTLIQYTTTGATVVNVTGLPAGVSGTWTATTNILSITGSPTASGTYTYTVTLTGGCASITTTGTITVTPDATINLISGSSTTTICINTVITPIVYTIGNAINATITWGSTPPAGINYSFNSATKQYTISGTSSVSGVFNYTINAIGICGTTTSSGSLTFKERTITAQDALNLCQNLGATTRFKVNNASTSSNAIFTPSAGITNFSASYNPITQILSVTGTPTNSGTYTFTVTSTDAGGCDPKPLTSTFTFTVKPDLSFTLVSGTPPVCLNTPITPIVYQINNVGVTDVITLTGITGLPNGLSGTYSATSKQLVISGIASESGVFNYQATIDGGCTPLTITGTVSIIENRVYLAPTYSQNFDNLTTGTINTIFALNPATSATTSITANGTVGNGITFNNTNGNTIGNIKSFVSNLTYGVYEIDAKATSDASDQSFGILAQTGSFTNTAVTVVSRPTGTDNHDFTVYFMGNPVITGESPVYKSNWYKIKISYLPTELKVWIGGTLVYIRDITSDVKYTSGAIMLSTYQTSVYDNLKYFPVDAGYTACINTSITPIVYETESSTSVSLVSGRLPAGLTGVFNGVSKQFTINGTATESGTFTYTLSSTGDCVSATTTGTITIKPDTEISLAPGSTATATTCINTPLLTPVVYNTKYANNAILTGTLPPGISGTFSTTTGQFTISGTATQSGTFTYTITAYGDCVTATTTGTITINPNATITLIQGTATNTICINNPMLTNVVYETTLIATDMQLTGSLPGGMNGTYSNTTKRFTITGTATQSGTFTYTITTFGGCITSSTTGTITVYPNASIALTSTATTISQTVCINNVITPIQYTTVGATNVIVNGLPNGVTGTWTSTTNTLNITGAPIQSGTFTYTVIVNGNCISTTTTGTLTVHPNSSITLIQGSETSGICVNNALTIPIIYETTWIATDMQLTGNLPAGLTGTYSNTTKRFTISGVATQSGTYTYTITTSGGCLTESTTGTITVDPATTINLVGGSSTPTICINTPLTNIVYQTNYTASNIYKLSGNFPPGITGTYSATAYQYIISGTPTQSGTFTYTLVTAGSCASSTTTGAITVNPINTITPNGSQNSTTCINTALTPILYNTTGSTGAIYSYVDQNNISYSGLPAGLTGTNPITTGNVTISGTPTVAGTYTYTVTLIGGCGSGTVSKVGIITVNPENTIALTSSPTTNNQTVCVNTGIQSITYFNVGATGTTETYSINGGPTNIGLPAGLSRNWTGGVLTISGTPTIPGTYNYAIQQTGGCFPQTATGQILVKPNASITLSSAPGTNNTQTPCVNTTITSITYSTTSTNNVTISSGRLPNGLTPVFNIINQTYIISGTPSETGTFTFTILAEGDCAGATTTASITVKPNSTITLIGGTASNTICINNVITNIIYQSTFANTMFVNGSLPAGVTTNFNPVTKQLVISGTATQYGTFTFTVVSQGDCLTATATGTITVKPDTQIALTSSPTTNVQTLCINTSITNINYTTQYANNISLIGLPLGVDYTFSATTQLITITGVPTQSGTFTYTIIANGDCISATSTGTIIVKPDATIKLVGGTATNTICINTPIVTPVVYRTTTSATDIRIISGGLPGGITGTYNSATYQYTISGIATQSGTFTYTLSTFGACVTATTTGTITVKPDTQIALTSAPSTNSQSLCINTLLTNIQYTSQNANNVMVIGLPSGLAYTFSATTQLLTISGVPTVSGTFTYTIIASGDCFSSTTLGTVRVNENFINLISTNPIPITCINTSMTPIVYNIVYANAAVLTGTLPVGVSWNYNSSTKQLRITGTPTNAGTFSYTINTVDGCATKTVAASMTVQPDNTITLVSSPTTNSQVIGIDTDITDIVYRTTGATNVVATNLPAGIQQSWIAATNTFRLYGTGRQVKTATYTVNLTGGCGIITAIGLIDVKPNNTITLSSTTGPAVCINTPSVNIVYKTTLATGATIVGLPNGLSSAWSQNGTDSLFTITGIATQSGNFNYTIQLLGGFGNISTTGSIRVDATTVPGTITASENLICNGSTPPTISLTGNTGSTIVWQIKSSTPSATYTNTNPIRNGTSISDVVNNAAPGSTQVVNYYQALVQNGVCNILTTNSVAVAVDPTSQVGTILPTQLVQEVCIGSPATSIVLPSNVGTIIWQTASSVGGTYRYIPGQTTATLPSANIPTGTANTTYYKAQVTSGVCPSIYSQVASVQVDAASVAGTLYYLNGNSPICNQSSKPTITLQNNTGNNIYWQISAPPISTISLGAGTSSLTYNNIGTTGALLNSTIDNTAPILNSSFRYYRAVVANGVCPADISTPIELEVIPTPLIDSIKPNERCGPGTIDLYAHSNLGIVNWFAANAGGNALSTSNNYTTPYLTKNINNYYVSGLFRGCSSLTRIAVLAEVITIPTVPPIPDSTYCGPHVFNICIKATDNGVVNWYTNPTGGNPFSIGDCYTTPVIRSNTTFYVDASFRGCTTVTRTAVNAIIFEVPVIAAVPNLNLCVGNLMSVTRYASLGKPPYLYTFITDSSQVFGQISGGLLGLNPGASNTSNVNGQSSGTLLGVKSGVTNVIFNIKDKNNCVSLNSNTFSLKTYDPVKPLNFNYQAYYQDDLIIPTKKDSGYILYNWNPGMNLNFTNIPEPIFNGTNTTDYVLVRTDTTSYCTVADNYHIDVTKDFILDVPNAFTPNYDGLNDKLRIIANAGIESIENFAIFNREGIQVFPINSNQGWSSKSIQPNYENHIERITPNNSYQANSNRGWDTWDGKDAQGKVLETDGYFWKAFIHFKDKSSKLQSGMFLLLK